MLSKNQYILFFHLDNNILQFIGLKIKMSGQTSKVVTLHGKFIKFCENNIKKIGSGHC